MADGIGEPAIAPLAEAPRRRGSAPPASEGLCSWLVAQPLSKRLELLAYLVACIVNAT